MQDGRGICCLPARAYHNSVPVFSQTDDKIDAGICGTVEALLAANRERNLYGQKGDGIEMT